MEFPSSDEDNDSDDDDDHRDDEQLDQHGEDPLPYNTLQISHYITSDIFSGLHSKHVFHRSEIETNLNVRLSVQQELMFYLHHYIEPKLIEILSNSRFRFFLWIAGRSCERVSGPVCQSVELSVSNRMSICLSVCLSVCLCLCIQV